MEKKESIILQVDESTKKMISELEAGLSEGFAETLEGLKGKIGSSIEAIETLKVKLNKINDIQDSIEESSSKSDEIKRGLENLLNVVSTKLKVDISESTSTDPLDKQATKRDVESSIRESLESLENLKAYLSNLLSGIGERHSDSLVDLSTMLENVKTSISSLQVKQIDFENGMAAGLKTIVETYKSSFEQEKEQISSIKDSIKDSASKADSSIHQQFENSQAERNLQFEQNQSALKSQSVQLSNNADTLNDIRESLITSFKNVDERLKDLLTALADSHNSYSELIGASFNSSRSEIQSEFSQLNASNRENYEKLLTDIKIIVDGISNGLLSIKSDVLSDAQGNVSQVLESIKSLQNHIDSRVAAVEKDCVLITNGIASLHDLMSSEMSNIKENQANIQKTLNEVLYHSISFWKIKARKAIKLINQQ